MAFRCRYSVFLVFFAALAQATTISHPLSSRTSHAEGSVWTIRSSHGFDIVSGDAPSKKKRILNSTISIAVRHGMLLIDGMDTKSHHVVIQPYRGLLTFGGVRLFGPLHVGSDRKRITFTYTVDDEQQTSAPGDPLPETEKLSLSAALYKVRVLLDELSFDKSQWKLSAAGGFVITDPHDHAYRVNSRSDALVIGQKDGMVIINGKKFGRSQAYIIPLQGNIRFNNNVYQGGFLVTYHKNKILLINNLDMEDYVACVLRTESFPGWPLEVNKALAIACRSYAIATVKQSRLNRLPYHIKSTTAHQTYKGAHEHQTLHDAVEQTQGIFLMHGDEPALAMYDSCCGGIIPAKIRGFNFGKVPYLKRTYACDHCKTSSSFSWEVHYSFQGLAERVKHCHPQVTKIKRVTVAKKDDAGLVQEVAVHGAKKSCSLSGTKVYSLLKPKLKSRCFSVIQKGDTITFRGKGHGHQIGLCQIGARQMVDKGYDHQQILKFYDPGTVFMRLG